MNDVKKLPKWAQSEIEVLQMRLAEAAKKVRAIDEGRKTKVSIIRPLSEHEDKPIYLPDDKTIRFQIGPAEWQWIDVRIRKTSEQSAEFLELMSGGDQLIAPEVRNVTRIFLK